MGVFGKDRMKDADKYDDETAKIAGADITGCQPGWLSRVQKTRADIRCLSNCPRWLAEGTNCRSNTVHQSSQMRRKDERYFTVWEMNVVGRAEQRWGWWRLVSLHGLHHLLVKVLDKGDPRSRNFIWPEVHRAVVVVGCFHIVKVDPRWVRLVFHTESKSKPRDADFLHGRCDSPWIASAGCRKSSPGVSWRSLSS